MQKIWNFISDLGTAGAEDKLDRRTIVLTNQLNFVMLITMFLLLIYTVITLLLTNDPIYYGTLRVVNLFILNFINLVLARYGFTKISRYSLIYLPPIVFILGPTLIGYVEEESYTYYPYVLIGVSIITQLLVHPKKEKFFYWFSLAYYFVLVIVIDRIMVQYGPTGFKIVDIINTFYPFYKIAQIGLFLFIHANIFYLLILNFHFEEELNNKNNELNLHNIDLKAQKDEIERQKDELVKKEISTWQKLVNIISHEIINSAIPITNLAGMTRQMLEDESGAVLKPEKIGEEITGDIHHSLKIIESRTKGLINFVDATKSLTNIPKPNLRRIPVHELLERITILYNGKFKESGIRFEKQIVPPYLFINADLELIEQVLINLIKNALEAMQETSEPRLSIFAMKDESEQVKISVSDNGRGISADVIEQIFIPFYSTKLNNSGIGLSLSQQIMMLHKGRLEVIAGVKTGATFVMIF
jgi:signal transduction histidine kinase